MQLEAMVAGNEGLTRKLQQPLPRLVADCLLAVSDCYATPIVFWVVSCCFAILFLLSFVAMVTARWTTIVTGGG